ncbi:MAG: membrane protein insertase YidC [Anaerohalosphaeraceae bacterium]|nr:membrane protein insertase YidC [Anaerohalosphaeraceae bacterium]
MNTKKILVVLLSVYVVACSVLIYKSGVFKTSNAKDINAQSGIFSLAAEADIPATKPQETLQAPASAVSSAKTDFSIISAEPKQVVLGSIASKAQGNDFLLELKLTSKGAAITTASLRDYDNRDAKNPEPMKIIYPAPNAAYSMASGRLLLYDYGQAIPLNKLNWQLVNEDKQPDGSQTAVFQAAVTKNSQDALLLRKTYTLAPDSYMLTCDISIDNLTDGAVSSGMEIYGPVGIAREGSRADMRKVTTAFLDSQNKVTTTKLDMRKLTKEPKPQAELLPKKGQAGEFMWAAIASKYFVAIARPVPQNESDLACKWIAGKSSIYYPGAAEDNSESNIGVFFKTSSAIIPPQQSKKYSFQIYLGPKDKKLFDNNKLYNKLGFVEAIDFQACFGNIFRPLSFFILEVMGWMQDNLWPHNYGIVIIIFVLIVRILLHPITKKSQVSMMKMSKLGPKAEEIKKKYANNKGEQQKQMMALYKEHGASPVLGCLPMLLQMPIWIALYSAIYASIDLRGAAFLPFWITDLSAPDSLFALPAAVENLPFIGNFLGTSFNLLPILLGASMFAQQKLMPSSASAANSQAAQQQKMMMWMMPIMMLVFLYRAPSGLNLYIMSSTIGGVFEQYVIRKHIREKEQAEAFGKVPVTAKTGGKLKKKKPKPPFKFS